jgi:DNA-binding NtrC family response regulator
MISSILTAINEQNFEAIRLAFSEVDPSDPLYKTYRALICLHSPPASSEYEERGVALSEAIDNPPPDVELFILLLSFAVSEAIESNQISSAQHAYNLMLQVRPKRISPEVETYIHQSRFIIANAMDDYSVVVEALDAGLHCSEKAGKRPWIQMLFRRFYAFFNMWNFKMAHEALIQLEPYQNSPLFPAWISYNRILANFYDRTGRPQQALDVMQKVDKFSKEFSHPNFYLLKSSLLIKTQQWQAAEVAINQFIEAEKKASGTGFLRPGAVIQLEIMLGRRALSFRNLALAREHAQRAFSLASNKNPRVFHQSQWLLANIELAAGKAQAASVVLMLLDPNQQRLGSSVLWARYHMLEGRQEEACRSFRRILEIGIPEIALEHLRFAYELTADQVAILTMQHPIERAIQSQIPEHTKFPLEQLEDYPAALVGSANITIDLKGQVQKVVRTKSPILILGETGVGKESIARYIHSARFDNQAQFVIVNCSTVSDTLLESELTGHVKGAFPGAIHNRNGILVNSAGGTVYLDEIQTLTPQLQEVLLLALEKGKVRPLGSNHLQSITVRIIAASSKPLEKLFRKDLYFLLNRQVLQLPPLYQRPEDIAELAEHFLNHFNQGKTFSINEDLMLEMKKYRWPGNIREFKDQMRRIVILAGGAQILTKEFFKLGMKGIPQNAALLRLTPTIQMPGVIGEEPKGYAHSRLEKLRQLFNQNEKLTCSDVIDALDCARGTANKDINFLMAEGYIRRIDTSGNRKTSYFVRANA